MVVKGNCIYFLGRQGVLGVMIGFLLKGVDSQDYPFLPTVCFDYLMP